MRLTCRTRVFSLSARSSLFCISRRSASIFQPCASCVGFQVRCRTNSAHIRQSRPDYGLGFQVTFSKTFKLFPLLSKAFIHCNTPLHRTTATHHCNTTRACSPALHAARCSAWPDAPPPFFSLAHPVQDSGCGFKIYMWRFGAPASEALHLRERYLYIHIYIYIYIYI